MSDGRGARRVAVGGPARARAKRRCRCSTRPRWAARDRRRDARCTGRSAAPTALELDDDGARVRRARWPRGAWDDAGDLDEWIAEAARNWRVERMAVLDRLVLRLAVHELLAIPATPPRVVIDEAIDLARRYSGDEAAKFVNGVLDGAFRTAEGRGEGHRVCRTSDVCPAKKNKSTSAAPTSKRSRSSGSVRIRIGSRRRTRSPRSSTRTAPRTKEELEADARRDGHGRPHHQHPQLRQGELLRAVRRPQPHPGLRPAGCAQRARFRAVEAARLRRPHRRGRASVPHQDQRAVDLGVAARVSRQVLHAAAREVARAAGRRDSLPPALSRSRSSIPRCGACSRSAAARSRRFASS